MADIRILYETAAFSMGRFRCLPTDPRWRVENWIGEAHVVAFPSRAVVIERAGRRRVVANPNHAVLYDADETYRRELLAPEGDETTFVELRAGAAWELLPLSTANHRPGFATAEAIVPTDVHLKIHMIEVRAREQSAELDDLTADELLADVVTATAGSARPVTESRSGRGRDELVALVDQTKVALSVAYAEPMTLAELGRRVGSSPFHLARAFRRVTGQSIHRYREGLRLREALRRIRDGETDLSRTALDVGFASLSHFDDRFLRTFGMSPSAARRARL